MQIRHPKQWVSHVKGKYSLTLKLGLVGCSHVRIRVNIVMPIDILLDSGMSLPKMFHFLMA